MERIHEGHEWILSIFCVNLADVLYKKEKTSDGAIFNKMYSGEIAPYFRKKSIWDNLSTDI